MSNTSIRGSLVAVLLSTLALGACPVWSQDTVDTEEVPAALAGDGSPEHDYQRAVQDIESSGGAYAEGLTESLLGLGLTLQLEGKHEEAIEAFRRATHLARINEGLYCPQQIPLLQSEIASYKATQNYAQADERQSYLYRVQRQSMPSGDALAGALMEQAHWQYEAYQLGLEAQGYTRLMDMWGLYQDAMRDIVQREGEKSPKLLPPLQGMLQAQYLISGYELQEPDRLFVEEGHIDESLLRFKSFRAKSYQQGNAIIEAISGIEQGRAAQDPPTIANTLIMLGDWRLWNGRSEAAWEAYRGAQAELARDGDAQVQAQQVFGQPVALPDFAGLNPLPRAVDPAQANVLLAFGVSDNGRVQDVERMDDNEEQDRQAARLMRQLRRTTFRPRFEAGQPVETEKLVKAFNIQ